MVPEHTGISGVPCNYTPPLQLYPPLSRDLRSSRSQNQDILGFGRLRRPENFDISDQSVLFLKVNPLKVGSERPKFSCLRRKTVSPVFIEAAPQARRKLEWFCTKYSRKSRRRREKCFGIWEHFLGQKTPEIRQNPRSYRDRATIPPLVKYPERGKGGV